MHLLKLFLDDFKAMKYLVSGFFILMRSHFANVQPGGDQFTLCFVDFTDPKCASIALEALQGMLWFVYNVSYTIQCLNCFCL